MGCGILSKKTLTITSYSHVNEFEQNTWSFKECQNKQYKLSKQMWINVMHFLMYEELREIGKINLYFKHLSKHNDILNKFIRNNINLNNNNNNHIANVSFCNTLKTDLILNSCHLETQNKGEFISLLRVPTFSVYKQIYSECI